MVPFSYRHGEAARLYGLPRDANPYRSLDPDAHGWTAGWDVTDAQPWWMRLLLRLWGPA